MSATVAAQHKQAAPSMNATDATALNAALNAYDNGNAAVARHGLEQLTEKYPANFPANEALGILYLEAGDTALALPCLERASISGKNIGSAQANLGAAYIQANNIKGAVKAFKQAVVLDPKNAKAEASLGHALYLGKHSLLAADAFTQATRLDPSNMEYVYNSALALYDAHEDIRASVTLQHIPVEQRSESVESLWGDVEERQGHFKEAVQHMQAAARINPSEPNTYAVAIELLRHWSWEPAMEITNFGIQQFPASMRLRLANGIAFFGAGRYAEASAVFGALLAVEPDNENYGNLLGRSCTAAGGGNASACKSLIVFAGKHPKNAQIDVSAAISLLHQPEAEQHLDEVQQLLMQAIQNDPKLPDAYYQLGVLQQQRLEWKESAASLDKAVELRPAFAEAHYRLSRAYSHTGQQELARHEIVLQQQYSQQEKDETNARLKEVTIFLTASH